MLKRVAVNALGEIRSHKIFLGRVAKHFFEGGIDQNQFARQSSSVNAIRGVFDHGPEARFRTTQRFG